MDRKDLRRLVEQARANLMEAEFVGNAIDGRRTKEGRSQAGKKKRGKHKVSPETLRQAVLAHPRSGKSGQWSSVCREVGKKQIPSMSGRQVRRILDREYPDLKW